MNPYLVCFLEEQSAKIALEIILAKMLPPDFQRKMIVFNGKRDLDNQLESKMRGWRTPNTHFLVLRDQDRDACQTIKDHLIEKCQRAGQSQVTVRIACRELEAFYLGDLKAVEQGLGIRGIAQKQNAKKYRQPDLLMEPGRELELLTNNRYQKIGGSRKIAPYLTIEGENRSNSFRVLIEGIRRLASTTPQRSIRNQKSKQQG